jgi:transposase
VSFAIHWPNRYAKMYGKRNHAETAFGMIQSCFGYRVRCRTEFGNKNEVSSKITLTT